MAWHVLTWSMKVIFAKSVCACVPTEDVSGDEALALQLQQEMDREARAAGNVEEAGLFFCQLCQKDLSSMSPPLRTQHINRCIITSTYTRLCAIILICFTNKAVWVSPSASFSCSADVWMPVKAALLRHHIIIIRSLDRGSQIVPFAERVLNQKKAGLST